MLDGIIMILTWLLSRDYTPKGKSVREIAKLMHVLPRYSVQQAGC